MLEGEYCNFFFFFFLGGVGGLSILNFLLRLVLCFVPLNTPRKRVDLTNSLMGSCHYLYCDLLPLFSCQCLLSDFKKVNNTWLGYLCLISGRPVHFKITDFYWLIFVGTNGSSHDQALYVFPKLPPLSLHGIVLVTADVEEIRKL